MSDTEYNPPDNSNISFHVGVDFLNLLFLYDFFIFFHEQHMVLFDIAAYFSPPLKFILSARLSNSIIRINKIKSIKFSSFAVFRIHR